MLVPPPSTFPPATGRFQINIDGRWRDYGADEDSILKKYYFAGDEKLVIHLRGRGYEFNFRQMEETSLATGRVRTIRPPPAQRGQGLGSRQPSMGQGLGSRQPSTTSSSSLGYLLPVPHQLPSAMEVSRAVANAQLATAAAQQQHAALAPSVASTPRVTTPTTWAEWSQASPQKAHPTPTVAATPPPHEAQAASGALASSSSSSSAWRSTSGASAATTTTVQASQPTASPQRPPKAGLHASILAASSPACFVQQASPGLSSASPPPRPVRGTPEKLGLAGGMGCMWGAVAENAAPWLNRLPGMLLGARSWAPGPLSIEAGPLAAASCGTPDPLGLFAAAAGGGAAAAVDGKRVHRPVGEPIAKEDLPADLEYAPMGTMTWDLPEEVPLATIPLGPAEPAPPVSVGLLAALEAIPAPPPMHTLPFVREVVNCGPRGGGELVQHQGDEAVDGAPSPGCSPCSREVLTSCLEAAAAPELAPLGTIPMAK